jgi:hypothetical protein
MRRQLQCHSQSHARSRWASRTCKFTNPSTPDLVEFAGRSFHLRFAWNHFHPLSNNWGKYILRFS